MSSLMEILSKPTPKPKEILLDRSELETYMLCPLMCKLRREQPIEDTDLERMKFVGIEFHNILEQWMDEWLAADGYLDVSALVGLALNGDPRLQPDLQMLAKITAYKLRRLHRSDYISHEKQYGYRIKNFGPHGESLVLTCRVDALFRGGREGHYWIPDWKSGWGVENFGFQAMFYSVVIWRAIEDAISVTWQPLLCRRGSWGEKRTFIDGDNGLEMNLVEAENVIKAAAMRYVLETEWKPTPGTERCRWCNYSEQCDAEKLCGDVDSDPEGFLLGTMKLIEQVDHRKDALKAKCQAVGPICADGKWYGADPIKSRIVYGINKTAPDMLVEPPAEKGKAE